MTSSRNIEYYSLAKEEELGFSGKDLFNLVMSYSDSVRAIRELYLKDVIKSNQYSQTALVQARGLWALDISAIQPELSSGSFVIEHLNCNPRLSFKSNLAEFHKSGMNINDLFVFYSGKASKAIDVDMWLQDLEVRRDGSVYDSEGVNYTLGFSPQLSSLALSDRKQ